MTALCRKHIGEGEGFRDKSSLASKDGGVDVVAWHDFPDGLPGKLLLFGACASGKDWEDKIDELQPGPFCGEWMLDQPVSPLIKAFFTPHRIEQAYWSKHSRRGGILFDRCRIASWTTGKFGGESKYNAVAAADWLKTTLREGMAT